LMSKLILLECDDFQKPHVKKILKDAEVVEPWEKKPDRERLFHLSRSKSANPARRNVGQKSEL
jgi:hypothetical protein